jgi:hypothetical protein
MQSTSTARRNSLIRSFKILLGIQRRLFRDFEWYAYLRRSVLDYLRSSHPLLAVCFLFSINVCCNAVCLFTRT